MPNKKRIVRTIPMILLLIVIGVVIISFTDKSNPSNMLQKNVKVLCASSICLNSNDIIECISMPANIFHLTIEKDPTDPDSNYVMLTQTKAKCGN